MGEHSDLTRLDPGGRGSQVVATRTRYGVPPSCPAGPGVVRFQHQTESTDRLSASPARKSHSKSQRRPVSGGTQLPQATVEAGQVPSEPSPATPGDAREVTGGQGVAGSNPAVPTGNKIFSNICTARQSQQKSHSLSKRPSLRPALITRPGVLPGHMPNRQRHGSRPVKGSDTAKPARLCKATRQPPNRRTQSPGAPAHRKPDAHRAVAGCAQAGSGGSLASVAASNAWAVGGIGDPKTLIERWNGTSPTRS